MKKIDPLAIELDIEQVKQILGEDPEKRNEKELVSLSNYLNNITFFKQYKAEGYEDVGKQCAKYMKYEFVKKGEPVFHIGKRYKIVTDLYFLDLLIIAVFMKIDTVGDKFYLTLKGRVGIYIRLPKAQKNDQEKPDNSKPDLTCVKELEEGVSFGELALLNNKPRLASIVAHTDSHFMTLDKQSFSQILKQKEEEKLIQEMGFFAKLPFFEGWNYNLIKLIYLNSFRIKYSKNEKVFLEGDEPSNVYIVLDGEFVIQKKFNVEKESDEFGFKKSEGINDLIKKGTKQTKQIQLAVLVKNEMFGEEDIMNKLPTRTYSAICSTVKGECILVKKRDFEIRILHEEGARLYLEDRLSKKQQYWGQKINKIKGSIADYSNFLIDDRQGILRQNTINLALKKIDTQSQFSGQEDSQNGIVSSSPGLEKNPLFSSSRSIIRKSTPVNPPLLKLPSTSSLHKNNRASQQIDSFKNSSQYISNTTFSELEKPDGQNNRANNLTNESSSHTPWRDYIAESYTKKIPETFMSLFSFQKEDYLQKENSKSKISLNQKDSQESPTLQSMESSQSSLNLLSPFLNNVNGQEDGQKQIIPFRQLKQLTLTVPTNEFSSKLNQLNLESNQDIILNKPSPLRHKRSNFFNYSNSVFTNNAERGSQHKSDQENDQPKSMTSGLSPYLNNQSQNLTQNNQDGSPSDETKEFLISEFNHFIPISSTTDSQLLMNQVKKKQKLSFSQLDKSQKITQNNQFDNEWSTNNLGFEETPISKKHSSITPSSPSVFPIQDGKIVDSNNVSKENKISTVDQDKKQSNKIVSLNSIPKSFHQRSYSDIQKFQQQNIQEEAKQANGQHLKEKQSIQILNPEISSSIQNQVELSNIRSSKSQSSEAFKELHLSRKQRLQERLNNTKNKFFKDIFDEQPLILLKSFSETTQPFTNQKYKIQKKKSIEINTEIIYESSFSPMKGKVDEIHHYKFEQCKEDKPKHTTLSLDRKIQVSGEGIMKNSFQRNNDVHKDQTLKVIHSNKLGELNSLNSIQNYRLKTCNSLDFRDNKNARFNSGNLCKSESKTGFNCRATTPLPFRTLRIQNSQNSEEESLELCIPPQRLRGQEQYVSHKSLQTIKNQNSSESIQLHQYQNKSCQDLKPLKLSNNLSQPFYYQNNYTKQSRESTKFQESSSESISEDNPHFFRRLLTSNQSKNKTQRITNQQLSSSLVISSQKEVSFHRIKTVSNAVRFNF